MFHWSFTVWIILKSYFLHIAEFLMGSLSVDHLNDVSCHYHACLDLIFLVAKKNNSTSTYVPVHSSFTLSPSWILKAQNELSGLHKKYVICRMLCHILWSKMMAFWKFCLCFFSILLVIRDGDSSSISYKLTQGLIPPSTLQNKRSKSEKSGNRNYGDQVK